MRAASALHAVADALAVARARPAPAALFRNVFATSSSCSFPPPPPQSGGLLRFSTSRAAFLALGDGHAHHGHAHGPDGACLTSAPPQSTSSSSSSSTPPPLPPFSTNAVSSSPTSTPPSPSSTPVPGVQTGGDMMLVLYTCRVCDTRSARQISKQGYHKGSVVVRCPGCKNLHLLSDHLGFFDDDHVDAESLLVARGELVRRGAVAAGADSHVFELTDADRRVLLSTTKSVRDAGQGEEVEVLAASGVMADRRKDREAAEAAAAAAAGGAGAEGKGTG